MVEVCGAIMAVTTDLTLVSHNIFPREVFHHVKALLAIHFDIKMPSQQQLRPL